MAEETWFDKRSGKQRLYPHLVLEPVGICGNRCWKCVYCGAEDEYYKVRAIGCTERKAACQWCGEKPLCAPDCVGIRMALSGDNVHVIGENPFPEAVNDD